MDLLDSNEPSITLVGTSFSYIPTWNFEGFLKNHMRVDIKNLSITAGGLHSAIIDWSRQANSNDQPQIVVWEFDTARLQANESNTNLFRFLKSAIFAKCSTNPSDLKIQQSDTYNIQLEKNKSVRFEFDRSDITGINIKSPSGKSISISRTSYMIAKPIYYFTAEESGAHIINPIKTTANSTQAKILICD